MVKRFQKLDFIIDEQFADRFGVKLLIDYLETDLSQLFVSAFIDG